MRTLESVLGPVDRGVMRHVDDECHVDDESESECESSDDESGGSGAGSEGGSEAAEIGALMAAMDLELEQSRKGSDFELEPQACTDDAPETAPHEPAADDAAEARPVDIDLNLVRNLLSSYSAQHGLAGPASNLLGSMGISLPDDADATTATQSQQ